MQVDAKLKNARMAAGLALATGPLGFLYIGWRYALTAAAVFLSLLLVLSYLLLVPTWFKFVNLPAFAFIAYRTCAMLNELVEEEHHRGMADSQTWPAAIFAMTSMLPLLAAFNSAILGATTAVPQFIRGDFGSGLFMLFAVTPLFAIANFVGFFLIATLIDRMVTTRVRAAPTYIFPPAVALGDRS